MRRLTYARGPTRSASTATDSAVHSRWIGGTWRHSGSRRTDPRPRLPPDGRDCRARGRLHRCRRRWGTRAIRWQGGVAACNDGTSHQAPRVSGATGSCRTVIKITQIPTASEHHGERTRSTASSLLPRNGPLPRRAVSFKRAVPRRAALTLAHTPRIDNRYRSAKTAAPPACPCAAHHAPPRTPRYIRSLSRGENASDPRALARQRHASTIADARSVIAATTRSAMRCGVKPISSCRSAGLPCVT